MNKTATTHAMDGFDVWFFGGTPSPNEPDQGCALREPHVPSIDEDDARIPAFAHRCDCGRHAPALAGARQAAAHPTFGAPSLALHV